MPETQHIERTLATNFRAPSLSKTNQEWVERKLSHRKEQRTDSNSHARAKERLVELRRLKPGWMNGEGAAPSSVALNAVERALDSHFAGITESPRVFPTLEGGVQLELFLGRRYHIAVEIHADAKTGEIGVVDAKTATDRTLDFYPNNSSSWRKVARLIETHS